MMRVPLKEGMYLAYFRHPGKKEAYRPLTAVRGDRRKAACTMQAQSQTTGRFERYKMRKDKSLLQSSCTQGAEGWMDVLLPTAPDLPERLELSQSRHKGRRGSGASTCWTRRPTCACW